MKFRYKFLLLLIVLSLIGCLYISQSYAYWMVTQEQTQANQIGSGCFSIGFTELNSINLTNTYPVDDTIALNSTPYEFTITNTCTVEASYTLTLNVINGNDTNAIPDTNIKYALYKKKNESGSSDQKPSTGSKLSTINNNTTGLTTSNITKSYNIGTGTLKAGTRSSSTQATASGGGSVTYALYLWIDKDANNDIMNKSFTAEVDVMSSAAISK